MKSILNTLPSNFRRELSDGQPSTHVDRTGFVDNWQTAIGVTIDTSLSISKLVNYYPPKRERNQKIDEYVRSGALPFSAIHQQKSVKNLPEVDYNRLAHKAKSLGLDIETDEEIEERVRADVVYRQSYAQDIFGRASNFGKVGQFAGTLHAAALDPIEVPTYFIGVGAAAKGAGLLSKVRRAAIIGGGTAAGAAALEEPFVYKWNRELGIDYGVENSISHIAIAAGLGAAIPTAALTVSDITRGLRKLTNRNGVRRAAESDPAVAESSRLLRETAAEGERGVKRSTPYDAEEFWGTETGAIEFWAGLEAEVDKINNTKPRKTAMPEEPVEPPTPENFDAAYEGAVAKMDSVPETKADITGVVDELESQSSLLDKLTTCMAGGAQ